MLRRNKQRKVQAVCYRISAHRVGHSHNQNGELEAGVKIAPAGQLRFILLTLATVLAAAFLLCSQPAFSQEGEGSFDQGPDGNTFGEVRETREEVEAGEHNDSILSEELEPLHLLWAPIIGRINEVGLDVVFNYTAMVQYSPNLIPGISSMIPGAQNTLAGGDVDMAIKWTPLMRGKPWAGFFRLSMENRHSYTDLFPVAMAAQTGSIWLTMRGWTQYSKFAVTEIYWHQGTLESPFEYRIGRVKNTTIWNGGKYISGNTGIVGGQFTGTPALVTFFSGWSINAVYHPVGGTWHITAGIFQANGDNETFEPLYMDQLTYALQAGWKPEVGGYKGRYHIFAWHVDATDSKTKANGFAINAEHTFNNWTPFIRYSFGDQDRSDPNSHPIRQSANLGVGYDAPFGQRKDWVALVMSWAQPTDASLRHQFGMEIDYSFRLTPNSTFTPHYQLIINPSKNPGSNTVSVLGIRGRVDL